MGTKAPGRWPFWPLAGIVAGGLVLRLSGFQNWSYWLDEAMQVSFVRGSVGETLRALRLDAVHPPLDVLVTWLAWHLGGGREHVLRLVPALWSSLATVAVYFLAGGARRPARATGAAVFFAAAPLSVYLGQEIRPYALALLLVAAAFALLEDEDALGKNSRFLLATLAGVLACQTLYLAVVPLAVLWADVLRRAARGGSRPLLRRALALPVPALALLAAWLWFVRSSLFHAKAPFRADLSLRKLAALANGLLAWREESLALLPGAVIPLLLIACGVAAALRRREPRHVAALAATTAGVTLLFVLADHWINLRYLALALLPSSVLAGSGVELLTDSRPRARLVLLAVLVALHVPSYREIDRGARPDWRQVATYIAYQRERGHGGAVLGLGDWPYLCLRAQPLVAADVTGWVTAENAGRALRGEGWLVATRRHEGTADRESLVGGATPWASCPGAEDALVYRFSDGRVVSP